MKKLAVIPFLLMSNSVLANVPDVYMKAINEYCQQFAELTPIPKCENEYISALEFKLNHDFSLEEAAVKKALDKTFEDGTFELPKNGKIYRFVEPKVAPVGKQDFAYMENVHHFFFLDNKHEKINHVDMVFRHGSYAGIKNSDHEVVHINRYKAELRQMHKPVYWMAGFPHFKLKPVHLTGHKLYEYKLLTFARFVEPNYTKQPDEQGTNGQWVEGHQFDSGIYDGFFLMKATGQHNEIARVFNRGGHLVIEKFNQMPIVDKSFIPSLPQDNGNNNDNNSNKPNNGNNKPHNGFFDKPGHPFNPNFGKPNNNQGNMKEAIVIYDQKNQKGRSLRITDTVTFLGDFNDVMSSFEIPKGWVVRFYEHGNFQGGYYTRKEGKYDAKGFDNTISSIQILRKPQF